MKTVLHWTPPIQTRFVKRHRAIMRVGTSRPALNIFYALELQNLFSTRPKEWSVFIYDLFTRQYGKLTTVEEGEVRL